MRDVVDSIIAARVNQTQSTEADLRAALADWGLVGIETLPDGSIDLESVNLVLDCFFAFNEHGILPCAGGLLDQPLWFRRNMRTLSAVTAFHERQKGKVDPRTLPRLFKE